MWLEGGCALFGCIIMYCLGMKLNCEHSWNEYPFNLFFYVCRLDVCHAVCF